MELKSKRRVSRILFGKPIPTQDAEGQTIGKTVGLAVFASDALSSVAYATQEILLILAAAGTAYFHLSLPIAGVIIALLLVLTLSYRQTIFAYPGGGGAYIVARENLGESAAQVAGGALLMDYILTVAVSISSGVDQIVSVFPQYLEHQVAIALGILAFMVFMNLRGVKESGRAFAFPTYFFVIMCGGTVLVGLAKWFFGTLSPVQGVEMVQHVAEPISMFLILKAFSSGCTALTGVEAISNGIPAFREPKTKNAAGTMTIMSLILGFLFLGITFIAYHVGALPSDAETVISQIGRTVFGRGPLWQLLMAGTTLILIMAANTSFADFPRLSALQAGDGFLPRQLTYRSSRLVFSWGIMFLGLAAGFLMVAFHAHTSALIPLYAIGVFMSFTLSQFGMVVHWRKIGQQALESEPLAEASARGWRLKLAVNLVGGVASFIVMCIFAITKFKTGAWITVIVIPAMVAVFFRIHAHYRRVASFLALPWTKADLRAASAMKTVILIDDVNIGTLRMVTFAKTLGHPWTALHVNFDERRAELVKKKWDEMVGEGEFKLIKSPFRLLREPVVKYIMRERDKLENGIIHVITGQLVVQGDFTHLLHSKNARGLLEELQKIERVIVTPVPYHLERRIRALRKKAREDRRAASEAKKTQSG